MARLIDADLMAAEETGAFISAQAQITDTATRLVNEVVHKKIQMLLADAPTVDIDRPTRSQFKRMAVQLGYEAVTYCKDCEYFFHFSDGTTGCDLNGLAVPVTEYDFCSSGERKNNGNEDRA